MAELLPNGTLVLHGIRLSVSHQFNPLYAELNPICHLLALLGAHHIFHVSGLRVKRFKCPSRVRYLSSNPILEECDAIIHYVFQYFSVSKGY